MKLIFLGDSITQGVGASDYPHSFVGIVGRETGAQVLNAGMGSTRIAPSATQWEEPHWHALDFLTRAAALPDDCDYIFIFGGTNDYGDSGIPTGSEDDSSSKTFAGAVKRLISVLTAKYGRERVVFITPCRRYREEEHFCRLTGVYSARLSEYVMMLKKLLDDHEIQYIDLYSDPEMPRPESESDSGCFRDGLHPNDRGHRHIADRVINFIEANGRIRAGECPAERQKTWSESD